MQKYQNSYKGHNALPDKVTRVLLIIYLIALFWILLLKMGVHFSYMTNRRVNVIPFREFFLYGKLDVSEAILNVVVFIPLGVYASLLWKHWTFGSKLLLFFLISFLFEALQFVLRIGAFDLTDILTNTIGGTVGFLFVTAIVKMFNNQLKAQKFINILAAAGTALMILLLVLLKLDMLPIRYR